MTGPSTRLRALMLLALVGVVTMLGVVVAAVAGIPGLLAYVLVAGVLVVVGIARGRAALAPTPLPAGRTCTCCTTTQHDPVRII